MKNTYYNGETKKFQNKMFRKVRNLQKMDKKQIRNFFLKTTQRFG